MIERISMQCPECGGEIVLSEDGKFGRCSSCENEFRYASEKTKEKVALLNQANFLRLRNDFEGALLLYSDLLKIDETDAEVYWGMVLAYYGIEYVADPKTGRNVPTCRRIVSRSIFHDKNYHAALSLAESEQRNKYRQEAVRINALQEDIKEKLKDEESYDVFICFKSSDEDGLPTEDRYVARRIFDELSRRGIKTFYSEISLKNKLGSEYEPIIYKALYTCKVMILVATCEEYINSIWVRNEWTRFRDRIHDENLQDASFAVFKNVSRSALPPIFRSQGVDLQKYPFGGFEIEISDTLAKRFGIAEPKPTQTEKANAEKAANENQNIDKNYYNKDNRQNNNFNQNQSTQNQQSFYAQNQQSFNAQGQQNSSTQNQQNFNMQGQQNSGGQNQQNFNAQSRQSFETHGQHVGQDRQNSNGQNRHGFGEQNQQNFDGQYGGGYNQARPRTFNEKAFHSKATRPEVNANLSREEVNKELSNLVREKAHYSRLLEREEESYNISRTAMKRAADQRKVFAAEKEKLDRIINTPDYFKKTARRKSNGILWLRLLLSVLMFVLVIAFVQTTWLIVLILVSGMLLIWYRQFIPVSKHHIDKHQLICKEREQQLREQIVQCEMQLASLNRKFDKSRQEMAEAEVKIKQCETTLAEYVKIYPYAAKQLEKINASVAQKVANVVSEGIIGIAGGIDKGINAVKDTFFK